MQNSYGHRNSGGYQGNGGQKTSVVRQNGSGTQPNNRPAQQPNEDRRGFFAGSRSIRIGPTMEIQLVRWTGYDDSSVKLRIGRPDEEPIELPIRFDGDWENFLNGEADWFDNIRGVKVFCDTNKKTISVKNLPRGELTVQLSDDEVRRMFEKDKELEEDRNVLVAENIARIQAAAKAKAEAEAAKAKKLEDERKAKEEAEKKAAEEKELKELEEAIKAEEAAKKEKAAPAPGTNEVNGVVTHTETPEQANEPAPAPTIA